MLGAVSQDDLDNPEPLSQSNVIPIFGDPPVGRKQCLPLGKAADRRFAVIR